MASRQKALGTALEMGVVTRARLKGLDAHRMPGSGVYREYPADAAIEQFLVECKVRTATLDAKGESIRLDLGWLRKVQEQAARSGMRGAFVVVRPKGEQRLLALVDFQLLLDLLKVDAQARGVVVSDTKGATGK